MIELSEKEIRAENRKSSKGNQLKWLHDDTWYKGAIKAEKEALPEGYYVVLKSAEFKPESGFKLTKDDKVKDTEEYKVTGVKLAKDEEIKVVSYDGEKVTATYPADKDGLKITEAGTYTVSFRPKADGDDKWYEKVLKAEKEQDASSTTIPSTTKSSTSSTTTTSTTSKAAVQTGDVSMALIILLVLLSATAGIYFARKKMN